MLIYRIERADGHGMYCSEPREKSPWAQATGGAQDKNHPIPWESDQLMQMYRAKRHIKDFNEYIFGFKDKRQLLRWVYDPQWRRNLDQLGVTLCVYKVDARHVCFDDNQVMFIRDKAVKVEELLVSHFD